MERNAKNKREIIKNILIIFLIIMLLLTFFSNTMMNRSLPEVSTQYASYKQISDKIRASATVTANQDYSIVADETREISEVLIRRGERVERGQVIFTLVENESSALSDAEQALNQLLIQKQQMLIDNSDSSQTDYEYEISLKLDEIAEAKEEIARRTELEGKIDEKLERDEIKENEYEARLEVLESEAEAMEEALEAPNDQLEELEGKMQRYESTYDTVEEITAELEENRRIFADASAVFTDAESVHDAKESEIDKLEDEVEALEEKNDEYDELISKANDEKSELEEKLGITNSTNANLSSLKSAMEKARIELAAVEREYNFFKEMQSAKSYLDKVSNTPDATDSEKAEAQRLYNEAKATYDDITGGVSRTEGQYLTLIDTLELAEKEASSNYEDAESSKGSVSGYESSIRSYEREIDNYTEKKSENTKAITKLNKQISELKEELAELTESMNEAETEMNEAEAKVDSGESKLEYANLRDQAQVIKDDIKLRTKALEKKEKEIEKHKADYSDGLNDDDDIDVNEDTDTKALETQIKQAERDIEELKRKQAAEEENAPHSQEIKKLELQNIEKSIALKEKEIERIKKELTNTEITSPVSGTVTNVSYTAGEEFTQGETIATVAISEKGYTMEFSATNEQCQRIKIGDKVELQRYYYGAQPEVTVSAFKNDPSNPGRGKIVVLNVAGEDITVGQTLNFTLGDRTQSYDKVVPNSAVREDANGKFVLVVESKSTPLGNRYTARRVSVEVITSDETSSALSGELMGGEFIITTASSPVSDGMQVRLADKN
ncbi:MAG: HlyD family efflux transporter periplasmic adaptor subunit [Clostridia bacterium]|nr:HlyD family efflux transporter periplasmic adaptor subunit [Clostridia bacterium]